MRTGTLREFADKSRGETLGEATLEFCDYFVKVTGGNADAHALRAYVRQWLGDAKGAIADCRIACRSDVFANEAAALLKQVEGKQ